MRASFSENVTIWKNPTGLLGVLEVRSQLARLAEVDVLRAVAIVRVVVEEHPDHSFERAGNIHLASAQKRHAVEAEVARRHRRELRVEVARRAEDAAHHLLRAEFVAP